MRTLAFGVVLGALCAFAVPAEAQNGAQNAPQYGPQYGGPQYGQQQYGMFRLDVCNWSRYHAKVALQARPRPGAQFETSGWYDAAPGRCTTIGSWANGPLDLYADALNSGGKFWDGLNYGGTVRACLAYPGPFKRINYDNTPCRQDEVSKLMQTVQVTGPVFTWTLN